MSIQPNDPQVKNIKEFVAVAMAALDAGDAHTAFLRLHAASQFAASITMNDAFARGQQSVMDMWHPQKPADGDEVRQ